LADQVELALLAATPALEQTVASGGDAEPEAGADSKDGGS
jgi:hypothetical protein